MKPQFIQTYDGTYLPTHTIRAYELRPETRNDSDLYWLVLAVMQEGCGAPFHTISSFDDSWKAKAHLEAILIMLHLGKPIAGRDTYTGSGINGNN